MPTAYQQFAKALAQLIGERQYVKIENGSWMPLSIERIGRSGDGRDLIAISHVGEQNGDLMRDPEIVFELVGDGAEPISFRNDYMAYHSEVYTYDASGRRVGVRLGERSHLRSFARTWFRNLRAQGFFDPAREAHS